MDAIQLLKILGDGSHLAADEAAELMRLLSEGKLSDSQAGASLALLHLNGVTSAELAAFAQVLLARAVPFKTSDRALADLCGTGGDGQRTFNISTAASIVAASCGVRVAKHGNRKVSSSCGSADVLEQLGVKTGLPPSLAEKCLEKTGFCFLFAPVYHPLFAKFAPIRQELGFRTVFNTLGPLLNPARPASQLVGVAEARLASEMAGALNILGSNHAMVVHSEGMDEMGLGLTSVFELKGGLIENYDMDSADFGLATRGIPKAASVGESAEIVLEVLSGKEGAARDVVAINAAAAAYVAGKAPSMSGALGLAQRAIDSGAAMEKLGQLRNFTGD